MKDKTMSDALLWAYENMPKESCGLVLNDNGKEIFFPCRNISTENNQFEIHPDDYISAENRGEIIRVIHSHVYVNATPSESDLVSCELTQLPWSIISIPGNEWHHFTPTNYKAPLIGREWCHGVLDCYSLIRDYYKEILDIVIPDFSRENEWWKKGKNLYLDNFKKAGFVEINIDEIKIHDVVLMQVMSEVANHGAIYLGNDVILHHLHNRLSCREIFGGYYLKNTVKVLRYEGN